MIVATRATNTAQLFRIGAPLASPAQITNFGDPVRFGTWWPPRPDTLVFVRDTGGNEQNQLYRQDPGGAEPALLTDPARTHRPIGINRARNRLLVASTDLDKTGRRENPTLDLSLLDPLNPSAVRKIATLPGTGWLAANFSFDDRQLAENSLGGHHAEHDRERQAHRQQP